jgi:putative membrane protein
MNLKIVAMTVPAVVMLTACGQSNTDEAADMAAASGTMSPDVAASPDVVAPPAAVLTGADFTNAAAASDVFEIESSKLAAANGQSAAIKSFAADMVKAHTDSTAKLKAAAGQASPAITPSPALKPDQQQQLDALKTKKGAEFDTAYAAAQVTAHQQALDLLQGYSAQGDVPSLKAFATELVPVVSGHLDMARGLKP